MLSEDQRAGGGHKRQTSCMSIPESENSSNGTFIDKGSCEELSKEDKTEALAGREAVPQTSDHDSQIEPAASAPDIAPPMPPESAFSTSDLSEQLSAPIA